MRMLMVVAGVVVLLSGGTVSAQSIVMCAKAKGGALKQGAPIKLRSACKSNEVQVDPVALGLRGPAGQDGADGQDGAAGAPGADGQDGAAGAPGLSGIEIVVANGAVVSQLANGTGTATASCPASKRVLGGGIEIVEDVGDVSSVTKVESFPVTTEPQGWTGLVRGNSSEDWHLRAYAICANAS